MRDPTAWSEADLREQVFKLANMYEWGIVYHRNSQGDTAWLPDLERKKSKGWPDLILVRPPRFLVVELKTDKGGVEKLQKVWLELLRQCPIEVYLWRPENLQEIANLLR